MMSSLQAKTVVITGAASGIGRAIAIQFSRAGANVVIADVTDAPWHGGPATEAVISREGGQAVYMQCDLSSSQSIEATIANTIDRYERIDAVVNNAAVSGGTTLLDTTLDEWTRVLTVNLTAPFLVCQAAIRQMMTQPPRDQLSEIRGRIINIGSQHGIIAVPKDIAYGTSKSGLLYLTRYIATEFASAGIVCNAVSPGKIVTGPSERNLDPAWREYWTSRTPWPRLGRPEDVASAALFLASDDATYITGANIMVDGGWTAC